MLARAAWDGVDLARHGDRRHRRQLGGGSHGAGEASGEPSIAALVLLPPPFYFKDVPDDGLFRWFGKLVLERLAGRICARSSITSRRNRGAARPRAGGPTQGALSRSTCHGVKDSSGDRSYAHALLVAHRDLTILIGDERLLAEAVRMGASGAISGLANIVPELLLPLANDGKE